MPTSMQYDLDLKPETRWRTISATTTAKSLFVYIQETGRFLTNRKYYLTRSGLDSFLLKLTLAGGGLLHYDNQVYPVGVGKFFWIDCNQWQHYMTDPDCGEWDGIWVHFSGPGARNYYDAFVKLTGGCPVAALPLNSSIPRLLQLILDLYPAENGNLMDGTLLDIDIQAASLLTQLMCECVLAVSSSNKSPNMPSVIHELRCYLVENYNQRLTLDDIAARFNLSPFYLQKLFKQYVGQSPTEYLIYLRIAKAKMLMRTTRQSISEISYTVGIENTSYFTRLFQKAEGVTPREYRRLWPSI